MIIYNITSQVAPEVQENWLEWMQTYYIPRVLSIDLFEDITIFKVSMDQPMDPTFATQYKAASKEILQRYLNTEAPHHKKEMQDKFGEQVLSFETHLEFVSKQS
tara:strand:- start:2422 stop:2733 length:312 start_codon:yes stop_codon:yes gene_type:complete